MSPSRLVSLPDEYRQATVLNQPILDQMSDEPPSALLMFVAHRAAEARVLEAVRSAGFDDLTLAQSRIGQRLDRDGIRITDLAEQAGVTKQTAGALVDALQAGGYVMRQPDPADARAR